MAIINRMTLSLDIPPQTVARLRQQADASGQDVQSYLSTLIERATTYPSLDETLAPLRKQFASMNVTEESLIADITAAQSDYRRHTQK